MRKWKQREIVENDVDEALLRFEEEVSDFDDSDEEILSANISDEEDHLIEHCELYDLNESDNALQSPTACRERDARYQDEEDINEPSDENMKQSREHCQVRAVMRPFLMVSELYMAAE